MAFGILAASGVLLLAATALASTTFSPSQQDGAPAGAAQTDLPVYEVDSVSLAYLRQTDSMPALGELAKTPVTLGVLDGVYVAPGAGTQVITLPVSDLGRAGITRFRADAILQVSQSILAELNRRRLISVFVAPDPQQIDELGVDQRSTGEASLRFIVVIGAVSEVRTLASGDRIADSERLNHTLHARIREESPLQPTGAAGPGARAIDVIRKDLLDRYTFQLSRHPGRRVDVAIAPSGEPGGVSLDYEITENRPLTLYAQISNTGTAQTSYWRERFGLIHNQLTNNDDILSLDYSTAGFDESHAVMVSYEAPLGDWERLRWRVYGAWDEYEASEIGFFGDEFRGETWTAGVEIAANVIQDRELFIDLVAGARYDDFDVDNEAAGVKGHENFLTPYVGARLERATEWYDTRASAMFEFQKEIISGVDESELEGLGRLDPDSEWVVFKWDASHSFFLEPILDRQAWEDPTGSRATLAHELQFAFRGQHSFGNRLIPQVEDVVGGLYTVRGYPESAVAADSIVVFSAEYRLHLPRLFGVESEPREFFGRPFRYAPQYVYGPPDWDLVLKGFVDVGWADIADPASFEMDEDLASIGLGVDLFYRRSVSIRFDWGYVLAGLDTAPVEEGSNRAHLVITFLY